MLLDERKDEFEIVGSDEGLEGVDPESEPLHP